MPTGTVSVPTTPLGVRLRKKRIKAGLTQNELAELIGTQANRVSDWERGWHIPTLALLERIAAVYDTTVSGLLRNVM